MKLNTGKTRLMAFLRAYPGRFIKTSEIAAWGANGGFSNRAMRNARELRSEGFLRRLSREEVILNGYDRSEGVYKIVGKI